MLEEIKTFFDVLKLESEALINTIDYIDKKELEKALNIMKYCKGKYILIGMGKSGIIAKKIAATFNSIGSTSLYLHPSEALHGDFGIANKEDIAIIISNSGETSEVIRIIPYLRNRNVKIISISKNENSTLTKNSDCLIKYFIKREADEYNLVPTTSTTVVLAIGDALAISLMKINKVTPELFAYNHPSGFLGKKLSLKVKDLMYSKDKNPIVKENDNWLKVIETMNKNGIGAVNVVNSNYELIGIITDGDIRRFLNNLNEKNFYKITSSQLMTKNPITVNSDLFAYDALELIRKNSTKITVLSVVDNNNKSIGMVKLTDLNKELGG